MLGLPASSTRVVQPDALEERAARGSREKFEEALTKIPDVEPEPYDRLPDRPSARPATGRERHRDEMDQ